MTNENEEMMLAIAKVNVNNATEYGCTVGGQPATFRLMTGQRWGLRVYPQTAEAAMMFISREITVPVKVANRTFDMKVTAVDNYETYLFVQGDEV